VEVTVAEPTAEQLDLLLALQDTDSRIRRLERQRETLPEQRELDEVEARVEELVREQDDLRIDLDKAAASQRQLERETDVLTERRDAERLRLYDGTVTNAREMKSVEAEVESTARRISEQEDLLLEALEQVEGLETHLATLESEAAAQRGRASEVSVARDEAAKNMLAELAEAGVLRDRQAADLPDELLERYDALVQQKGGVAVGLLESNTCTACRIGLSMADVGELLAGPPLTTCPECRRLLVVPA
jgi:predicted  nucleic acid-binding Zn-ribbon protein